ncbi:RNA-binding protein 39 [Acipenser ruthenus]|uniref:RNA-binding protein 39 n=1 Tax=Acipenser ruthenus TaxID=7906 RepID=A0A444UVW9_ACIRT|nr:RNA-binding protein 39 [Acipenser ruthenus]
MNSLLRPFPSLARSNSWKGAIPLNPFGYREVREAQGKMITAAYVPLATYHNLFPESVMATQLLMPIRR